jgi:uncharacterized membrane protein (UPF0127 family)
LSTSSKTPSSVTEKTASEHNFVLGYGVLAVLLVIVVLTFVRFFGPNNGYTTLHSGRHGYSLQMATTPAAQEKGLGNRDAMPADSGMLFVFPNEASRCFWMKDMRFPLDIIWTNKDKKVVYVQPEVSPSTYPDDFCPSPPAQYVIELNAGEARRAGIRAGETLTF